MELGFEFEMEKEEVRLLLFDEMKKKEKKCKGVVYICFGICEGVVI